MKFLIITITLAIYLSGCKSANKNQADDDTTSEVILYDNPPAEGFNIEGSNPTAIMLADQAMNAMGGRAAWDNTNYISWNFFGRRQLFWDKSENKVRIDRDNMVMSLDMDDMTGQVWKDGELMQNADSVSKYLKMANNIWINDAYWLFMPFKLKDSGVTISYIRDDSTMAGEPAIVLWMTFEEVGNTPQNAYEVWISSESRLVRQWAFYRNEEDEEPAFVQPWDDYQQYGDILLSGDRGDRKITDIKVWKKAPKEVFTSPESIYKESS